MAKMLKKDYSPEEWENVLARARAYHKTPKCRATTKAWREANKDKIKATLDKWRERNPDKVAASRLRWRRDKSSCQKAYRKWNLKKQFGMTIEAYESVLNSQGGVCAICLQLPKDNLRLAVDHNHSTGKNRGLLCGTCNFAISKIENDPDWGTKAINYLAKYIENYSTASQTGEA